MPSLCSPAFCTLFIADRRMRSSERAQGYVHKCLEQLWEPKKQILKEPFCHLQPTSPGSLPHPLLLLTSPGTKQPSTSDFNSSTVIAIWDAFTLNSTTEQYFQLFLTITRRDWFKNACPVGGLHGGKPVPRPQKEFRPVMVPGPRGA